MMKLPRVIACATVGALLFGAALSTEAADGMKKGTPDLQSAGPITFGPQGILIVGDPKGAAVFAIDTNDASGNPAQARINVEGVEAKIAQTLKLNRVQINDMAANPLSGNVYLSVTTSGPENAPAIVKVDTKGAISEFSLKDVPFSKAVLVDAPEDKVTQGRRGPQNLRMQSITDVAFMDGQVLVSGLSNAKSTLSDSEAASSIRALSFPFSESDPGTALEIYHGAHGKYEDYSALKTFVPFNINGEPTVLAAYTCTPLVKFPVKDLVPGKKTRGTTVAELGNRNQPLDMVVYKKDGKEFLLMANSARGVMKVSTENIGRDEGITEPVRGGGVAGQEYITVTQWEGVTQLDKLNDTHAVIIAEGNLITVELP
jgi:hypothetical protein